MDIFSIANHQLGDKKIKRKKTKDQGFSKLIKSNSNDQVENQSENQAIESTFNNPFIIEQQTTNNYQEAQAEVKKAGKEILKHLNNIRLGLLNGELSNDNIRNLTNALEEAKLELKYPELKQTIDNIKLRAAVEIAKYEQKK